MSDIDTCVTPLEVRNYSVYDEVKLRADDNLNIDISRAVSYVKKYTNNNFDDYDEIPGEVKTAILILSEYYSYREVCKKETMKSETLDDYSYTRETNVGSIEDLDVNVLLENYVVSKSNINMKLRRL